MWGETSRWMMPRLWPCSSHFEWAWYSPEQTCMAMWMVCSKGMVKLLYAQVLRMVARSIPCTYSMAM